MILLNGNFIAATILGVMCACGAFFDILGGPKEKRFPPLPRFIRWEIRVTVVVLAVRMANLYSMVDEAPIRLGEVNGLAIMAAVCLMVTIVSLTGYALSMRLPFRAWDRLSFVKDTMRRDPDLRPVMVGADEVVVMHRATGQATVGGGGPPEEVAHEAPRYGRMVDRADTTRLD